MLLPLIVIHDKSCVRLFMADVVRPEEARIEPGESFANKIYSVIEKIKLSTLQMMSWLMVKLKFPTMKVSPP